MFKKGFLFLTTLILLFHSCILPMEPSKDTVVGVVPYVRVPVVEKAKVCGYSDNFYFCEKGGLLAPFEKTVSVTGSVADDDLYIDAAVLAIKDLVDLCSMNPYRVCADWEIEFALKNHILGNSVMLKSSDKKYIVYLWPVEHMRLIEERYIRGILKKVYEWKDFKYSLMTQRKECASPIVDWFHNLLSEHKDTLRFYFKIKR